MISRSTLLLVVAVVVTEAIALLKAADGGWSRMMEAVSFAKPAILERVS